MSEADAANWLKWAETQATILDEMTQVLRSWLDAAAEHLRLCPDDLPVDPGLSQLLVESSEAWHFCFDLTRRLMLLRDRAEKAAAADLSRGPREPHSPAGAADIRLQPESAREPNRTQGRGIRKTEETTSWKN
jgi:hypothetical protein